MLRKIRRLAFSTGKLRLRAKGKHIRLAFLGVFSITAIINWNWIWSELSDFSNSVDLNSRKFMGVSVWSWISLPLVVALTTLYIQKSLEQQRSKQAELEREIANNRYQQEVLSKYLDQMTALMLTSGLRQTNPNEEVFILAQARTVTALRQLDIKHRALLINFLRSADLVNSYERQRFSILENADLKGADLREINFALAILDGADLINSNLSHSNLDNASLDAAQLCGATLHNTNLEFAILTGADLRHTDFSKASLKGANLRGADLSFAKIGRARNLKAEQLEQAKLCQTELPDALQSLSNRDC